MKKRPIESAAKGDEHPSKGRPNGRVIPSAAGLIRGLGRKMPGATAHEERAGSPPASDATSSSTPLGSSSVLTEFSPEHHSWIMVPTENFPLSPTTSRVALVDTEGQALDTSEVAGNRLVFATSDTALASSDLDAGADAAAFQPTPAEQAPSSPLSAAKTPSSPPSAPSSPALPRSPLPASIPSSPCMLRESISSPEGEAVAALAISELLDPASTFSQPVLAPSLACSREAFPPQQCDPSTMSEVWGGHVRSLQEYGLGLMDDACCQLPAETEDCGSTSDSWSGLHHGSYLIDEDGQEGGDDRAADAVTTWGRVWGRSVAIALVLLATHAAVLYVGVHIGKAAAATNPATCSVGTNTQSASAARADAGMLTSLSPSGGQQPRLCAAS